MLASESGNGRLPLVRQMDYSMIYVRDQHDEYEAEVHGEEHRDVRMHRHATREENTHGDHASRQVGADVAKQSSPAGHTAHFHHDGARYHRSHEHASPSQGSEGELVPVVAAVDRCHGTRDVRSAVAEGQ